MQSKPSLSKHGKLPRFENTTFLYPDRMNWTIKILEFVVSTLQSRIWTGCHSLDVAVSSGIPTGGPTYGCAGWTPHTWHRLGWLWGALCRLHLHVPNKKGAVGAGHDLD